MNVSLVVVVWLSVPAAPLIVIVIVPVCAREAAVSLSVVAVPGVAGFFDHVGETPLGSPVTLIVVGLLNPFWGFTVTDSCVLLLRLTDALAGALIVKSAGAAAAGPTELDFANPAADTRERALLMQGPTPARRQRRDSLHRY